VDQRRKSEREAIERKPFYGLREGGREEEQQVTTAAKAVAAAAAVIVVVDVFR